MEVHRAETAALRGFAQVELREARTFDASQQRRDHRK